MYQMPLPTTERESFLQAHQIIPRQIPEGQMKQPTNKLPEAERLLDPCKVLNTFGSKKAKTMLPLDFEPSRFTVLVGRTRECQEHIGNRRLRAIVNNHLQQYNRAPDKLEKTAIVTRVYNAIRATAPIGHFVKFEKGRYFEVGERTARERIGAMFRDSLYQKYRSSAKNKVAARTKKAEKKAKQDDDEGELSCGSFDETCDFEDFSSIFD